MEHGAMIDWHGFFTYPYNVPQCQPGVYGLRCIPNGKWYVGIGNNLAKRSRSHGDGLGQSKIARAIRKHGRKNFVIIPLFYCIGRPNRKLMGTVETTFIRELNSIQNGYNIIEHDPGAAYKYGAFHSELLKAAFKRPEVIERVTAANQKIMVNPAVKLKLSAAVRAAYDDPIVHEKISAKVTASWQDLKTRALHVAARSTAAYKLQAIGNLRNPTSNAKRTATRSTPEFRAASRAHLQSPEMQEKRNQALRAPGVRERKAISQRAAFATPEFKKKHAAKMREINDRPTVQAKRKASVQASWERRRAKYGPTGRPPKTIS